MGPANHHCMSCDKPGNKECIKKGHLVVCSVAGCDDYFQPLLGCAAHPYNRAFNMEVKERTSKNGRVDVKSLNQYREEVREAQEEAELLIERERLADLEKPKTKPRNTPAKVAGLIKWQNACEKQLAEAEAAALEHANGQDAPKQEEAEDANGDGPRNN